MELKDCPFCGSKARIINDYASVVVCSNPKCFISMEAQHEQLLTIDMAIKAWNTRSDGVANNAVIPRLGSISSPYSTG